MDTQGIDVIMRFGWYAVSNQIVRQFRFLPASFSPIRLLPFGPRAWPLSSRPGK